MAVASSGPACSSTRGTHSGQSNVLTKEAYCSPVLDHAVSGLQQSLNPGEDIAQGSRVANGVGHHIVGEHPVDAPRGICAVVGLEERRLPAERPLGTPLGCCCL